MKIIGNDWDNVLKNDFMSPYYQTLRTFLDYEYAHYTVFPPAKDLYNALRLTSYAGTKVVILGQDPYHEKGQAIGLSFAVNKGIPLPPSLQNIYKELEKEYAITPSKNGDLRPWAKQGVLLLNSILTVREGQASSHAGKGWEQLTDAILKHLNEKEEPCVFLLWGRYARNKKPLITNPKHLVLESAHPSPLSAYNGFFGNNHFRLCNEYLIHNKLKPIDWTINN